MNFVAQQVGEFLRGQNLPAELRPAAQLEVRAFLDTVLKKQMLELAEYFAMKGNTEDSETLH